MLTKVLERKWVIRFFGIALILAPFINTLLTMSGAPPIPGLSRPQLLWRILSTGATTYQILYVCSIAIGALMLSGSISAWRYALALLGGYIVIQFSKLGTTFKHDKMSLVFFAVNVAVFFFIADQLVWKQRPSVAKAKEPQPAPNYEAHPLPAAASSRKQILIHLEGFGNWAQLVGISGNGVHVRSIVPNPPSMEGRMMEMMLRPDLILRVKFVRQLDSEFHFDHVDLKSEKVHALNQWLQQKAA
jgi:hypothetical protein